MTERILIFTPTYDYPNGDPAMAPECEAAIRTQQMAADWTWTIGRHNPFPGSDHRNVLAQYQQARQVMLDGGYDALLTIEHDNVLPDDNAVQRLLDTPGDVIYAPYVLRHGVHVLSVWRYSGDFNIGESLTLHQDELAHARRAVVWRVSGVGMGCTLFRRHALEQIAFRPGQGNSYAPDIPFAQDALRLGLISNARMDVPVLHRQNEDWLHPYMTIGLKKYFCRVNVNALATDGERFTLVQGTEIEMLPSQAYDLVRAGFLTIFDQHLLAAQAEVEAATAEPDGEAAVLPNPKRRKAAH
ncbi:MAG: hypothetical protein IPM06_19775 [Rhizobiales bacterium]|nr:hypothetical protein [Hyphomicrobiales bacterium]